jgi:hypothetical protein
VHDAHVAHGAAEIGYGRSGKRSRTGGDETSGSTRREFLAQSGAVAGLVLVAGGAVALPGSAAPATGLTDARRRTYAALADSVVTGPSMRLPAADVEATVEAFARVYDGWPPAQRTWADGTLDALGAQGVSPYPPRLHSALPTGAERAHVVLLEAAMVLVAAVVGQPDGGHDSEVI